MGKASSSKKRGSGGCEAVHAQHVTDAFCPCALCVGMAKPPLRLRPTERDLRMAEGLLRRLESAELEAVIPVLQKYALHEVFGLQAGAEKPAFVSPGPPPDRDDGSGEIPPALFGIEDVAEVFELIADLMAGSVGASGDTCDETAVACFIHNEGEVRDRVESLFALTPIARRVFVRWNAEQKTRRIEESLAATKAVVKGKKVGKGAASNGA